MENNEDKSDLKRIKLRNAPEEEFLKKLEDNIYGVRFIGFKARDYDTGDIFHQFKTKNIFDLDYFADHFLHYVFPHSMLLCKNIGTNLTFVVGDKPVKNLEFIEKHYIDGSLMKSFEFSFPFFMPNSENDIEFIYSMPQLPENVTERIKKGEDIEASSDTYVCVEGNLIIHRRAQYKYAKLS